MAFASNGPATIAPTCNSSPKGMEHREHVLGIGRQAVKFCSFARMSPTCERAHCKPSTCVCVWRAVQLPGTISTMSTNNQWLPQAFGQRKKGTPIGLLRQNGPHRSSDLVPSGGSVLASVARRTITVGVRSRVGGRKFILSAASARELLRNHRATI